MCSIRRLCGLALAAALAVLGVTTGVPADGRQDSQAPTLPRVQDGRKIWRHERGFFLNSRGVLWVESSPDGTFHFREVERTRWLVELHDERRDFWVLLTEVACFGRGRSEPYRLYYRGSWER